MNQRRNKFFERITSSASLLTPTEKNIADHLMQTYPNCLLKNASEVSREIKVNVSTVTRFFQKIGYRSIREAQFEFRDDISSQLSSPIERFVENHAPESDDAALKKGMTNSMQNIQRLCGDLPATDLYQATDLLLDTANTVYITSNQGRAFGLAHYFFSQLKAIRPGVILLGGNTMELAGDLVELNENSVLFVYDFRPYTKLSRKIAGIFKRHQAKVIVVTDSPFSPIGENADVVFTIPTQSISPFESYLAGFFLMEIVVDLLARERMDYIKENYKKLEKRNIEFDVFF